MKFICTQENFAHGLHVVSRAASRNVALPILNNVLLVAENGVVRLLTTNLEVAVTTQIRAKVEVEGKYTANSRLISDYITALKNEKLTIETVADGLQVTGDQSETVIKGLPAEEFPVLPTVQSDVEISLPTAVFSAALQEVLFAASSDEARPEISGVFFQIEGEQCTLAATDSHRLSERTISVSRGSAQLTTAIIPARAGQEILRVVSGADEMTVRLDGKQAAFRCAETEIVTRIIEGKYPEYRQIIPKHHDCTVVVAKTDLVDAIKAASIFSQPGIHDLTMQVRRAGQLVFQSASAQAGRHTATISAQVTGEEKEVVFNSKYFLDGVQSLSGDAITIELGGAEEPGVLRGESKTGGLYLIMPIRQ